MIHTSPVLDSFKVHFPLNTDLSVYPFNVGWIQNVDVFTFEKQVTFFVGENGTGKSTILEALAEKIGLGMYGSKNLSMLHGDKNTHNPVKNLADSITLSWRKKVDGYFFRAETFWDTINKLEIMSQEFGGDDAFVPYGGKNLHHMSHGESFLAFFKNRIGKGGIYLFDEPEAALSPQRQLAFLSIIHELCKEKDTQCIIVTHSPILLAFPDANIYSCDGEKIQQIQYEETDHFQVTKNFLDNKERYFKHLFT